ncbi:Transposon Tf2-6 polyprotein, partial [Nosema granulosis]
MNKILKDEIGNCAIAYPNDIIIFSKNEKEHDEHLKLIFSKLNMSGIILNKNKCRFKQKVVHDDFSKTRLVFKRRAAILKIQEDDKTHFWLIKEFIKEKYKISQELDARVLSVAQK